MTNEMQPSNTTEENQTLFGKRLKSKRESFGLDRKEAAAQLRLNEKIIIMMESDKYHDLPLTFIRGYLRSYAKLLQIPEFEVNQAIDLIKTKPEQSKLMSSIQPLPQSNGSQLFMQFFTFLIMLTLIALVGTWWYRHTLSTTLAENRPITLPNPTNLEAQQAYVNNNAETTATSATIDKKALGETQVNVATQQKSLMTTQTPVIIAKTVSPAPSQDAVSSDDNDGPPEDSNETE